jgi:RNA polymerase sigma factor for flagellar operon FliA
MTAATRDAILRTLLAFAFGRPRRRLKKRRVRRQVRPRPRVVRVDPATTLVTDHLGIVRTQARWYARRLPPHVDRADLESAGTLGLIDAARRYDPTRGATFATYATWRVRGAIVDQMRANGAYTRAEHRRLEHGEHVQPRVEFNSSLADTQEVPTTEERADPFLVARVRRALLQLPRREAQLLVWRFWHDLRQVDCCPRLRVNESRVSVLERRALGRLRVILADMDRESA